MPRLDLQDAVMAIGATKQGRTFMQPTAVPAWVTAGIEPFSLGQRFRSRLVNNFAVSAVVIGGQYLNPAPTVTVALLAGSFLYYILFYWLLGGHIGHLLFGGRVRDTRTGGRIAFWQAVVRTGHEIAILAVTVVIYTLALPLGYNLAAGASTGLSVEVIGALAIAIPMGIMVLVREYDHRHLFDLLSQTIVAERHNPQDIPQLDQARASRWGEALKGVAAGVVILLILVVGAWARLMPGILEVPPPSFAPGEREQLHQDIKVVISDYMGQGGQLPPTDQEYRTTCNGLEKLGWDFGGGFHLDSAQTLRTRAIASGLSQVFKNLEQITKEGGYADYRITDFCQDVRDIAQ